MTCSSASDSVFNGKIVVSGGQNNEFEGFKSVETYDHIANAWTYSPDLVKTRSGHESIAVKNKLFVFESRRNSAEVFESVCNMFVLIKLQKQINVVQVISVGCKILIW